MTGRALRRALALTVAVGCAVPFGVLGLLSVADGWTFPDAWPAAWSLRRWADALGGEMVGALGLSAVVSLVLAAASTLGGLATGRAVAQSCRPRLWLFAAYLPFASSPVVLGVCLLFLWLKAGLAGTVVGVVLAQLVFAYGFAVVFFAAFWTPRLVAYGDLVRTLGGTAAQALRLGVWPVARPAAGLCFAQTFLLSWFQYGLTLVVGAGRVQTLPVRVFAFVGEADAGMAAVASLVLVAPPLAMVWLNRRLVFAPDAEDAPAVAHL